MAQLRTTRLASLGALLLAFLMAPAFAQERFTREVTFDIAAQSVEAALIEFSRQADVQVMVGSSALNGQKTEGVKGKLSVSDALSRLLKNTGLEYQAVRNTVTIRSNNAAAKADARVRPLVDGLSLASRDAAGEAASKNLPLEEESAGPSVETLDEVVVTGTHIRGADAGSPVLSFSALDIAASGYSSIQDWIETVPQNFSSVPNEESGGVGNFNRGTTVNLRGLGAGTTLILVNGRRQPASGNDGDFVDISSLPSSAIERVEVLTDGASAIYGSDAIGGVVNIILRRDFSGAETTVRYAAADGSVDEKTASQLFGGSWNGGHALLAYQYYERAPLQYRDRPFAASSDKRPFGGNDFRSANSNPGNILNPFTGAPLFAIPPGQDGRDLEPSDLLANTANLQNQQEGAELLPERAMHSAFLSASHDVSDAVSIFLEARYSERTSEQHLPATDSFLFVPSSNPFFVDPFGGSPFVVVGYNFVDDFDATSFGKSLTATGTLGATLDLPRNWSSTISGSWGEERLDFHTGLTDFAALSAALADPDPATAFNPFGDGSNTNPETIARIRGQQIEKSRSETTSAGIIADGPLFSMAGGSAKIALGMDHRKEDLARGALTTIRLGREITSAYAEVIFPFVTSDNARRGLRQFSVSTAGRFEHYDDFGDTFNPKISVRVAPLDALEFRATWGTSFRAPKLLDLDDKSRSLNASSFFTLRDPASLSGVSLALLRFGGDSSLTEETASTWTAGLALHPTPTTSVSLSYYSISYEDRIVQPGPLNTFGVLAQEDVWGEIITRNPSRAEVDAICNDPNFRGLPAACLAILPNVIVDFRKRNISQTKVNGIDVLLSQQFPTALGDFSLALNGTYVLNHKAAITSQSQYNDSVDTIGNPVSRRARATFSWNRGGYDASVSINYTGDYDDNTRNPVRSVDDWSTVDARLSYATPEGIRWMTGFEVAVSVSNLFDEEPPFVNSPIGYDVFNATALGRFVGLQLKKNWGGR